jgi:hypothetical protein
MRVKQNVLFISLFIFYFENLVKQTATARPMVFTAFSIWGLNHGTLRLEGE